jgi:hypothetical protein
MNKRSVKKSRPAKASRNPVARKAVARRIPGKVERTKIARKKPIQVPNQVPSQAAPSRAPSSASAEPVARQIAMPGPGLRTHKFRVGQTVLFTSSPITRPGASGTYKVVKLLPSDGDDYQYRIKNSGEAFERVAKESQLETEH